VRIALDFDGTIADAATTKVRYARERWGLKLTVATSMRPGAVPLIGEQRYEQMIADVYGTELSLAMDPVPGAVEALQRLAAAHDLHVVTARWEHERVFAEHWLATRDIPVASLTVTGRGSKVGACALIEADLLFEDSPAELAHFSESGRPPRLALLETPYNADQARSPYWATVSSWAEFEDVVASLS
jgi:uncharacterized HAD superfamily protein